ncbi:hypothetical protein D3C76_957410 [compost metagenome]
MPRKTKSAEDSVVPGLEPKTEINLIRGFKATKRVNPSQSRASTGGILSAKLVSVRRTQNDVITVSNQLKQTLAEGRNCLPPSQQKRSFPSKKICWLANQNAPVRGLRLSLSADLGHYQELPCLCREFVHQRPSSSVRLPLGF